MMKYKSGGIVDLSVDFSKFEYKCQNPMSRSKYHREIKPGVWIDVYDVLIAFNVTNPADAHAIKKLLMPGQRGHKDATDDRREAIVSIERAIQLECEK